MSSSSEPSSNAPQVSSLHEVAPPIRPQLGRPDSKRLEIRYHLLILVISVVVLMMSFALRVERDVWVVLPGLGRSLPSTCTFRNLSGVDCPGCGLTRSFICLAHGQWTESLSFHPIGWLVFGLVAVQVPFRLLQISRLRRNQSVIIWPGAVWIGWAIMMSLLGQWVVRGVLGRW